MHEFAYTKVIYDRVRYYAEQKNAVRVTDVYLSVGELRAVYNEWVIRYFAYVGKGSITEGAKLHIETIPGTVQCQNCGEIVPVSLECMPSTCPKCGEQKLRFRSGNEFFITGIGIVDKEEIQEDDNG